MTSNYPKFPSDPSEKSKRFLQGLEHIPIKIFINWVRNLPDQIMESHGILMSFDLKNEIDILFAAIRYQYRAEADWLEYYEANGHHLIDELRLTGKANFQLDAKRAQAYLSLAKECFLLSDDLRFCYCNNPGLLWYAIMAEMCEEQLKNSGLTGEPLHIGTGEQYKQIRHMADIMTVPKKLEQHRKEPLRSPICLLLNQAALLAERDENTRFKKHYEDFWKVLKRCSRDIERSNHKNIYLKDGEIQRVGRGSRGRGKPKL